MTDTTTPAADEQPHPFDPDLPGHIAELIAAWQFDGATQKITFAGRDGNARMLSLGQLAQLLERDAYAEKTRLQLAEACATLRGQRDDALAKLDTTREQREITDVDEIEAFPIGTILLERRIGGEAMAWRKERDGYWFPSTFSWVRPRGALWMAGMRPTLVHIPALDRIDTRKDG